MITHRCLDICGAYAQLVQEMQNARRHANGRGRSVNLDSKVRLHLSQFVVGFVEQEAKRLGLKISILEATRFKEGLEGGRRYTSELLVAELESLQGIILTELGERKFAYMPPPNDKYFEQEKLFGAKVYDKFPDAREDIKDSGNCLAAGLYTAAVFHLIRVSEHGLRALAKKLKVRLKDKGKPQPLTHADWNKVITECQNAIKQARTLPAGPKKERCLQFHSEAADHCEYIKDLWRNEVSHTRKRYIETEGLTVFTKVSHLMTFLGERVL